MSYLYSYHKFLGGQVLLLIKGHFVSRAEKSLLFAIECEVHFFPKIRYLQIYVVDNAAIALLFLLVTAISLIMKLLMLYADRFAYHPAHKTLDQEPDCHEPGEVTTSVVGLIHAEAADEDNAAGVEKKLVKNLKWGARKNETRRIVLHSFSHLAETKASAEFTRALLQRTEERLSGAGYEVLQTPFGYFLDLDLQAPGRSTARIFTSF